MHWIILLYTGMFPFQLHLHIFFYFFFKFIKPVINFLLNCSIFCTNNFVKSTVCLVYRLAEKIIWSGVATMYFSYVILDNHYKKIHKIVTKCT